MTTPRRLLTLLHARMAARTEALSLAVPQDTRIALMRLYMVTDACCGGSSVTLALSAEWMLGELRLGYATPCRGPVPTAPWLVLGALAVVLPVGFSFGALARWAVDWRSQRHIQPVFKLRLTKTTKPRLLSRTGL